MSSTNKTLNDNLTKAQDYLNSLKLPEGFTFELQHKGQKTFVLEDVSEEVERPEFPKDRNFGVSGFKNQEKPLPDQVEELNKKDLVKILLDKKAEENNSIDLDAYANGLETMQTFAKKEKDIFEQQRQYAAKIYKETCGTNCKIKDTPAGNTKREYLKSLNDKKTPESFFNDLENILNREKLTIEKIKEFLHKLKDAFMTTEEANDYDHRVHNVVYLHQVLNLILSKLEEITLL